MRMIAIICLCVCRAYERAMTIWSFMMGGVINLTWSHHSSVISKLCNNAFLWERSKQKYALWNLFERRWPRAQTMNKITMARLYRLPQLLCITEIHVGGPSLHHWWLDQRQVASNSGWIAWNHRQCAVWLESYTCMHMKTPPPPNRCFLRVPGSIFLLKFSREDTLIMAPMIQEDSTDAEG